MAIAVVFLDLCASHPVRLAGKPHHPTQLVQGCPTLRAERGQHVAQIDRILGVPVEILTAARPGAATPWTIARYRRTGRSKDEPLNVTSCGERAAILSTNDAISSFSDRSPTWGAPSASTVQYPPSSRCATSAPIQMIEW